MNLETKKSSRVHQLRDLFQMGKPRPAEELDDVDISRTRSNTSPASFDCDDSLKTLTIPIVKETKSEDLNINLTALASTLNLSEYDSTNPAWVVRKHRTISDSDIDLSKDLIIDDQNQSVTSKVPGSVSIRKPHHEFNVSILCPIVPFSGNQSTKIRPLGEEFKARRISKNLQDETNNNESRSPRLDTLECWDNANSTSLSNNPPTSNNDASSTCKHGDIQCPTNEMITSNDICNRNHTNDRDLVAETKPQHHYSDSDVDKEDVSNPSSPNHVKLSTENMDDLLESYTSELTRISADMAEIDLLDSSSPSTIHRAVIVQSNTMTPPEELIPNGTNVSDFQDFLLELENFQIEKAMNAESIDLEERTITSEEDNDDEEDEDGYVIASRMNDTEFQELTPDDGVISYDMICPKPMDIVSIEDGCHILEDGNFFYKKDVELESELQKEFECQIVKKTDEEIITTYKRPGAKVHFHIDKITVYSTHDASEYDRKNEDVDPLSASAEYEMEKRLENMNIFPVDLYKGSKGLGISILGMGVGHSTGMQKLGIFVKSIIEGGAAQEDGRIQVYDQIVEVNGESLVSVSQEIAASVLRNTHGVVHFLIGREIDQTNSEIVRLVEKSRQNSGIVSKQDVVTPAPLAEMEDEITKLSMELKSEEKDHVFIQDNTTFSMNPDSQTEDEDYPESEPFGTATSIIDGEYVGTETVSTQTIVTWEQIREKENLLNDVINDLNNQLDQCHLNEDKMYKTIFEIKDKIEDNHIMKSEMELLQRSYDEIQTEYSKTQTDLQQAQQLIEELSEENTLIKDKLEETTKKYKKVKRIFKMAELRNESHRNFDNGQTEVLTFYEEKVKHLENQVEELEFKLASLNTDEAIGHSKRKYEPVLISSPSDEVVSIQSENDTNKKGETVQPKSSSVSSSDMEDEPIITEKNVEISSRKPQRRNSDKVLVDLNINMSNSNSGNTNDIFDEISDHKTMLDNRVAKNKAELRKTGLMANRKPPSKAIMIGYKDVQESNKPDNATQFPSDLDNTTVEDSRHDSPVDRSPIKGVQSKVVGGFALPGKNEIKLASEDKHVKSKHKSRIFGIKPSNIVGSKKMGKITQSGSDDLTGIDRDAVSSKSNTNHKESVILLSAKTLDNDAMFDRPAMNFYNPALLPNESAKGDSYTLKDEEAPSESNELYRIPPSDWDKDQVIQWFRMIGLGHVENILLDGGIVSGYKLIRLDSDLIKKIGVSNSNDRMILKRKIKELRHLVPVSSTKPLSQQSSVDATKISGNHKSKL